MKMTWILTLVLAVALSFTTVTAMADKVVLPGNEPAEDPVDEPAVAAENEDETAAPDDSVVVVPEESDEDEGDATDVVSDSTDDATADDVSSDEEDKAAVVVDAEAKQPAVPMNTDTPAREFPTSRFNTASGVKARTPSRADPVVAGDNHTSGSSGEKAPVNSPHFSVRFENGEFVFTAKIDFVHGVHWDNEVGVGPYTVRLRGIVCLDSDPVLNDVPDDVSEVTFEIDTCDRDLTLYLGCQGANGAIGHPWCYGGYKIHLSDDGNAYIWE